MSEQTDEGHEVPDSDGQQRADPPLDAIPDDLTTAEILAQMPPDKPRRKRRKDSAKNLGVSDAERDHPRPVSLRSQQDPAAHQRSRRWRSPGASSPATPTPCTSWSSRNLRFVISVAKKYQNRGLALPDLIGEGNVGLLTAARKFDPDQGVKFISYAVWWIRQSILAALARQGRTVRVPLNRTADLSRIVRSTATLRQELEREPTPEEIATATGLAVDVVQSLVTLNSADVRLDAPVDGEGDMSLIDRFTADEQSDPEAQVMEQLLTEEIDRALRLLPARDAKVLRLYFGLNDGREHTLEEIGGLLGVTRERVRQLRDRALKRLREGEMGRALASFAA